MKNALRVGLFALLLVILFGTSALLVSADATATHSTLACDQFSASGTSDSPFVTLYVSNLTRSEFWFVIIPVSGGKYSGTLHFPAMPAGTVLNEEVWGSLDIYTSFSDPNYYDEGAYFNLDAPCTQTVSACPNPLPPGSTVYNVPQGAPAFYDADPNTKVNFDLPAGTWEISDFSGDYAHVWIACQATPIWIPKSAVGSPVG